MLKRIKTALLTQYWNIGFVEGNINDVLKSDYLNINWLKHSYKDRWFADPYILSANETEIVVLVEEFMYCASKGRIAKLVIDRKSYKLMNMKILLELPTHLSFPFIYRKGKDIFIMPENGASNASTMYSYNVDTDKVTKVSEVSHLPLTDAIIYSIEGKEYLFSTKQPNPNAGPLQVFEYDSKEHRICMEPVQEIHFPISIARNAGNMFEIDGVVYRPAQDCVKCYGNGIILQRAICSNGKFSFENVKSFYSNSALYDLGYHTFNMKDGLIVVDGHGRGKYKIFNKIIDVVKGF